MLELLNKNALFLNKWLVRLLLKYDRSCINYISIYYVHMLAKKS